ncbi:pyridine nucleotide-disulfide oxidoreductase [Angustibacter aerolatus]|uniref:Pyridine nucleotide-disulfide oxidoreductase n=1 Tax=Angustibacter aerolatus TaxID=1162965 RepID=A0ABQ6JKK3_9ACTN|nr:FAD-dependent oxidoreductase [Angustibacter aerolatus]GMA87679.1 pyridine nucleotide-disulfide oxidoreductase [Angustibacter aerolatus]
MSEHAADVVVVGLGPGGEDVAGRLAEAGLEVVAVNAGLVGGECPYWGCIPSKMMVRGAGLLAEARRVPDLAGSVDGVTGDWSKVATRIRDEATDDWDDQVAVDRLTGKGVTFVRGRGRLVSTDTVEVDGERYTARKGVVVATGSAPSIPPIDGIDTVDVWTNHEFIEAKEPARVARRAGRRGDRRRASARCRRGTACRSRSSSGPSGCSRWRSRRRPSLVLKAFEADGVTVRTGVGATGVRPGDDGGVVVTLDDGSEVAAERLLVASGRRVDVAAVGLDVVGVDPHAHAVPVDEWCRVEGAEQVWALGDVVGHGAFTHMSMFEADVVVRDLLGQGGEPATWHAIPRVTFTDPEVGAVGLTEAQAREQYPNVRVGSTPLESTTRGWIHGPGGAGVIHVVEDADRGVLVGATSVGPCGGEVLGFLALAVHARIPVSTMLAMPYAYPTFHRGIETALKALRDQ